MAENNEAIVLDSVESREARAFAASEMVECSACLRKNPPTRNQCLYCGATLTTTERNINRPALAPAVESTSEKSFHVVALPVQGANVQEPGLAEAASQLNLAATELIAAARTPHGVAVSRTGTADEAQTISDRLRYLGIETITVTDDELNLDRPLHELRKLEFTDASLLGSYHHAAANLAASWEDVLVIVTGRLHATTVEVEQKRNRGGNQLLNERELSTDEAVLDLHFRTDDAVWRIKSASFDFSCLGEDKALTAFENFAALISLLRRRACNADFDDSYVSLRPLLNKVWPIDEGPGRTERRRTGLRDFEAKVISSDNETQFTRYSRLLRFLCFARLEDDAGKA